MEENHHEAEREDLDRRSQLGREIASLEGRLARVCPGFVQLANLPRIEDADFTLSPAC